MKSAIIGLCGGLLLAISAIAGEQPTNSWFVSLDHNGDGGISVNELQAVRYERFIRLDINRDNAISPVEASLNTAWTERLKRMDRNSDGQITLNEFEDRGRSRFTIIDIDANGRISAHEALNFQRKVRKYAPEAQTG